MSRVTSTSTALVQRALFSGTKGQLAAVQELSLFLRGLDSATEPARETYAQCLEHQLITRLLQPLAGGDRPLKDSPLLQATLSCLANLACISNPSEHVDSVVATLIVRALKADSSVLNQRTALACVVNLSQNAKCVKLLRAAQVEPLLKGYSSSPDTALRGPASKSLRFFRDHPDSTLQVDPPPRPSLVQTVTTLSTTISTACTKSSYHTYMQSPLTTPQPSTNHCPQDITSQKRAHTHTHTNTHTQICLQAIKSDNTSAVEQRSALHGIARFLGALSPDSAEEGDVLEAASARDLCIREGFAALALRLLHEHELREGLRAREASDSDASSQRALLSQLVHAALTNLAALAATEVHVAGGTHAMLKVLMTHEDSQTRQYALAGLSNVCKHPPAAAMIRESEAMGKLRKLGQHANLSNATHPQRFAARIVALVSDGDDSASAHATGDASSAPSSGSQEDTMSAASG